MSPGHGLLQADVRHAYLQACLRGPAVYLVLPRSVWPPEWQSMRAPCLRLRKAIYGLKRSGFDWAKHAEAVLAKRGWQKVEDVADSLFVKGTGSKTLLMALYVDDVIASGPRVELKRALNELRGHSD